MPSNVIKSKIVKNSLKEAAKDFIKECVNSGYHSFTLDW